MVAEPCKKTLKELKKDIKRIEGIHAAIQDFVDSVQASGGSKKAQRRNPTQKRKKQSRADER